MYIEQVQGRHLALSFASSIQHPFFPLPENPAGFTRRLSGIYGPDENGAPVLRIDVGDPVNGPHYDVHFIFGEGDRLRTAEHWDMVSGVIARPKLVSVPSGIESQDNTEMAWAYPLSNYWKAEDDENDRFKSFHGWE